MKKSLWFVALVFGMLIAFSGVALAGGVWTKSVTPVYELPALDLPAYDDDGVALTIPAMVEVSVYDTKDGFVQLDSSKAYTDTIAGKWVAMSDLTSVEPPASKAKKIEEKMKALQAGTVSVYDLFNYFKDLFALMQPAQVPVAAVPVPSVPAGPVASAPAVAQSAPAASAPAVAAPCVDKGDRWSGLGGKNLTVPSGCEVWISSDPATVTVNKVSATSSTRLTLFVAGPAEINIAIGNPANAHYHIAPAGGTDANNRDGAETNWVFQGGRFAPRPEKFR